MRNLAAIIASAFPVALTHAHIAAARETEAGDRVALAAMNPKRNLKMTTQTNTETDAEIAKHLAAADAAASSTGASFRESMRKITELQSAEIERLRAIISDYSSARPRKPISIANRFDADGRSRGALVIASDGSMWRSDGEGRHMSWERLLDLPQPSDQLGE